MGVSIGADVICIGGAAIGSAVAYYLTENPDFDGTVAVIEPDPSYDLAQTSRAQNSIREQFSQPVNIAISQFGLDFIENFDERTQVDGQSPELNYRGTGYLFLARDDDDLERFEQQMVIQHEHGAETRMLTPAQVADEFPYMDASQVAGARMGSMKEGSFDGWAYFQGYRQRAIHNGAKYITDRVVDIEVANGRATGVVLERVVESELAMWSIRQAHERSSSLRWWASTFRLNPVPARASCSIVARRSNTTCRSPSPPKACTFAVSSTIS